MLFHCKHSPRCDVATVVRLATRSLAVRHHECDKSDMRILCAILNVTKVSLIKVVTVSDTALDSVRHHECNKFDMRSLCSSLFA